MAACWTPSAAPVPRIPANARAAAAAVRDAAVQLEGVTLESRGEQRLRNVPAPIPVFAARLEGRESAHRDVDPVCRMVVGEGREVGTLHHNGADYRFCSLGCIGLFAEAPDAYVD